MTIPMIIIAFLCVLGGIYPNLITNIIPYQSEIYAYAFDKVIEAMLLIGISGALFFFGIKTFRPHKKKVFDFDYLYINIAHALIWMFKNPAVFFSAFVDLLYAKTESICIWFYKVSASFFKMKKNILLDMISKIIKVFGIKDISDTEALSKDVERLSLQCNKKLEKIEQEKIILSDLSISFSMLLVVIMFGILLIYTLLIGII